MSNSIITDEIALRALRVFAAEIHADNLPLLVPAMRAALEAVDDELVSVEREACAALAESLKTLRVWLPTGDAPGQGEAEHTTIHGKEIAAAIRERTAKEPQA